MVYTYDRKLFSPKKEGNPDTCYNIEDIMLSEINQSEKDKYCMILLIWDT